MSRNGASLRFLRRVISHHLFLFQQPAPSPLAPAPATVGLAPIYRNRFGVLTAAPIAQMSRNGASLRFLRRAISHHLFRLQQPMPSPLAPHQRQSFSPRSVAKGLAC